MKSLCTSFLSIAVLACLASGQKNEKPKVSVIWGPDPTCHEKNATEVKALKPECSSVELDTVTFYIVKYAGVYYAMSHRPSRDYLVTSVQISNKTESAIHVNPLRSKMASFARESDFSAGAKGDVVSAESQDDLRQVSYRESSVIGERDGGIRSGLRVEERYEDTIDRNGRIVSRVTRIEPAAPPSSNPTPSMITNEVRVPRAVFNNVMKSKTMAAGEKIAGHVVFKAPDKEGRYIVFYLNAGSIEFVFPAAPKR